MLIIEDMNNGATYFAQNEEDTKMLSADNYDVFLGDGFMQYRRKQSLLSATEERQNIIENLYKKGIKVNPLKNLVAMIRRNYDRYNIC